MKRLRLNGYSVVLRSAGSHSAIDIVAIDAVNKVIKLIQSKLNITPAMKEKLLKENSYLNGDYAVIFETNEA